MPIWTTDERQYVLPESLEDIGETISGSRQGLTQLGFGSENPAGTSIISATKDNFDTFLSITFVYMGGRNFTQVVVLYMHGTTDGSQLSALLSQVISAINFPSL